MLSIHCPSCHCCQYINFQSAVPCSQVSVSDLARGATPHHGLTAHALQGHLRERSLVSIQLHIHHLPLSYRPLVRKQTLTLNTAIPAHVQDGSSCSSLSAGQSAHLHTTADPSAASTRHSGEANSAQTSTNSAILQPPPAQTYGQLLPSSRPI